MENNHRLPGSRNGGGEPTDHSTEVGIGFVLFCLNFFVFSMLHGLEGLTIQVLLCRSVLKMMPLLLCLVTYTSHVVLHVLPFRTICCPFCHYADNATYACRSPKRSNNPLPLCCCDTVQLAPLSTNSFATATWPH